MHRTWKYALLPLTLGAALLACPGADEEKSTLELTVARTQLDGNGQSTAVYITALDAQGQLGTGTVVLTTKFGELSAEGGLEARLELRDGKASTTYTCSRAKDQGCAGTGRIQAEWNGVRDSVSLLFPAAPDAGSTGDGGTPSDGGTDAGTPSDGGTDAG